MALPFQVTFDCADPHRLAEFWSTALAYEVENHAELIDQLLEAGELQTDEVVDRHGRKCWAAACACADSTGTGSRLLFQVVPESKTTKNRVHLDLNVGSANIAAEVERLIKLGATRLWAVDDDGNEHCVTLSDPEGNEFCVQ